MSDCLSSWGPGGAVGPEQNPGGGPGGENPAESCILWYLKKAENHTFSVYCCTKTCNKKSFTVQV